MADLPMSHTIGSVTFSAPQTYTEAHHVVHTKIVSGAPPIPMPHIDAHAEQRLEAASVHYHWRTQHQDTMWMFGNLHTHGPIGDPAAPVSAAVIHSFDGAPDWLAEMAWTGLPRTLRLVVPGRRPQIPDPVPAAVESANTLREVPVRLAQWTANTDVHHVVHGSQVTGADPLLVPAWSPGRPDRWMRPMEITVVYRLVDQPRHPGEIANRWEVHDVRVTGPWVTETGEFIPARPGRTRAPLSPPSWPQWVRFYVDTHWPTGVCLEIISAA